MFLVTAIISTECVRDILEDLKTAGIEGVTLSKVKGKGRFIESYESTEEHIRLEIVVSDRYYKDLAKEAIRTNARNLTKGSGKIWVTPVLEVERIRTGERDTEALTHTAVQKEPALMEELLQECFTAEDTPAS
ncbi:MAG TPA: P-II family nitrogen regulator [Campylobacteraceae bacterium]|nr:P-II family nitrogen regulator [Campylobacteraceae bacterium]